MTSLYWYHYKHIKSISTTYFFFHNILPLFLFWIETIFSRGIQWDIPWQLFRTFVLAVPKLSESKTWLCALRGSQHPTQQCSQEHWTWEEKHAFGEISSYLTTKSSVEQFDHSGIRATDLLRWASSEESSDELLRGIWENEFYRQREGSKLKAVRSSWDQQRTQPELHSGISGGRWVSL